MRTLARSLRLAEKENQDAEGERQVAERTARRKVASEGRMVSKKIDNMNPRDLSYHVFNLLLSMTYYDLLTTNSFKLLPGCPFPDIEKVKSIPRRIGMLESQEDLIERLQENSGTKTFGNQKSQREVMYSSSAKCDENTILLWICSDFGHELTFLERDERIPGFAPARFTSSSSRHRIVTSNLVLKIDLERII